MFGIFLYAVLTSCPWSHNPFLPMGIHMTNLNHQFQKGDGGLVTCQGVVATRGLPLEAGACCCLFPGCPKDPLDNLKPSWEGTTGAVLQLLSHLCPYYPKNRQSDIAHMPRVWAGKHIWLPSPALVWDFRKINCCSMK